MQSTTEAASKTPRGHDASDAAISAAKSELLELCFPRSAPDTDEVRRLAYANSICLLFIVLAVVGIKTPVFHVGPHSKPETPVPVVFEPLPLEQAVIEPPQNSALAEPNVAPLLEAPQVVPVIAADTAQVAFAIPVEGPVILTPAKFAAPPPRVLPPPAPAKAAPAPVVEFSSSTRDGGTYPEPDYPRSAIQRRMEGRVMLFVIVDPSGAPRSVEVRDSSGYTLLDKHAVEFVKRRWHWPAGEERQYLVPFRFQMTKD